MFKRLVSLVVITGFFFTSIFAPDLTQAQGLDLPLPGTMVNLTRAYVPVLLKGLKVHPDNPLLFDFILDTGDTGFKISSTGFKVESEKLIKYFLASLTIKEDDLWVNLSPYEKNRIIPNELGKTELGADMLAQDYILKQLTASLIYPEKQLGKEFWARVYAKAQRMYGSSRIALNTFNKVWIIADKAKVLERNNTAYVVGSHLKVMLQEDYLSLQKHGGVSPLASRYDAHLIGADIVRKIIIPELEKEVNHGENFAPLRQMFYSMILASWYKLTLKSVLLNQVYSNKDKTGGVLSDDPAIKERIYQQYLQAYKKGVFNYIKQDIDSVTGQSLPRKYFSGGERFFQIPPEKLIQRESNLEAGDDAAAAGDLAMATVRMDSQKKDPGQTASVEELDQRLQNPLLGAGQSRPSVISFSDLFQDLGNGRQIPGNSIVVLNEHDMQLLDDPRFYSRLKDILAWKIGTFGDPLLKLTNEERMTAYGLKDGAWFEPQVFTAGIADWLAGLSEKYGHGAWVNVQTEAGSNKDAVEVAAGYAGFSGASYPENWSKILPNLRAMKIYDMQKTFKQFPNYFPEPSVPLTDLMIYLLVTTAKERGIELPDEMREPQDAWIMKWQEDSQLGHERRHNLELHRMFMDAKLNEPIYKDKYLSDETGKLIFQKLGVVELYKILRSKDRQQDPQWPAIEHVSGQRTVDDLLVRGVENKPECEAIIQLLGQKKVKSMLGNDYQRNPLWEVLLRVYYYRTQVLKDYFKGRTFSNAVDLLLKELREITKDKKVGIEDFCLVEPGLNPRDTRYIDKPLPAMFLLGDEYRKDGDTVSLEGMGRWLSIWHDQMKKLYNHEMPIILPVYRLSDAKYQPVLSTKDLPDHHKISPRAVSTIAMLLIAPFVLGENNSEFTDLVSTAQVKREREMVLNKQLALPKWADEFVKAHQDKVYKSSVERMAISVELSRLNVENGTGGPFGAAIFNRTTGQLVSIGVNRVVPQNASIAHAEMMAIIMAQERIKNFTLDMPGEGFELATSAQPCAMCFGAIPWSGVKSVIIGATGRDVEDIVGFDEGPIHPDWPQELTRRGIHVERDVLREDAVKVLKRYVEKSGVVYNGRAMEVKKVAEDLSPIIFPTNIKATNVSDHEQAMISEDITKAGQEMSKNWTMEDLKKATGSLRAVFEKAWADDTKHPSYVGHPRLSAGQCWVTAMILSKLYGWDFYFNEKSYHSFVQHNGYWIDLTADQFNEDFNGKFEDPIKQGSYIWPIIEAAPVHHESRKIDLDAYYADSARQEREKKPDSATNRFNRLWKRFVDEALKEGESLKDVLPIAVLRLASSKLQSHSLPLGGIDLNARNLGLDIVKVGQGVDMKPDPAMVAQFQKGDFAGIVPFIIRITPISSASAIKELQASGV